MEIWTKLNIFIFFKVTLKRETLPAKLTAFKHELIIRWLFAVYTYSVFKYMYKYISVCVWVGVRVIAFMFSNNSLA